MLIEQIGLKVLIYLALIFVFILGAVVLGLIAVYVMDVTQHKHTIRRNYPIIGRFRYWFEHLGEFFRQYFFALDREELPFNRAERSWVYRAAKNVNRTLAFGSTRDLHSPGAYIFLNSAFPILDEQAKDTPPLQIGPYCQHPFEAKRVFNISGMSYGALSKPAVSALSAGAGKAQCWMNTGEGGLAPAHLSGNCDIVFQIGTAKYGVRNEAGELCDDKLREVAAHPQVKMFELKLSQGAKPGKGGILPGAKVTAEIASIRGINEGQDSISPNAHKEIKNVDDLLNLIERIRTVTGKPVGFKAVLGERGWIEQLCHAILDRGIESAPDFITLDSADGGTGAAPQPLLDYVGLPIQQSLPWLVQTLREHDLKERIRIVVSGKLITPSRVAWALAVGADFITSARGFMFALGCIQALQCNKNTCPTGITTNNKKLQRGLNVKEKAARVANLQSSIEYEVGMIAHSCGVSHARQLRPEHVVVVQDYNKAVPIKEMFHSSQGS